MWLIWLKSTWRAAKQYISLGAILSFYQIHAQTMTDSAAQGIIFIFILIQVVVVFVANVAVAVAVPDSCQIKSPKPNTYH